MLMGDRHSHSHSHDTLHRVLLLVADLLSVGPTRRIVSSRINERGFEILKTDESRMSAMIECAFINSVITSDRSYDRDKDTRVNSGISTPICAQQDTMEKRISGLRMMWMRPSAGRDKSE